MDGAGVPIEGNRPLGKIPSRKAREKSGRQEYPDHQSSFQLLNSQNLQAPVRVARQDHKRRALRAGVCLVFKARPGGENSPPFGSSLFSHVGQTPKSRGECVRVINNQNS